MRGKESEVERMKKDTGVVDGGKGLIFGIILAFFIFLPIMVQAVTLDRSGIKVESLITDTSVEFVGHTFTRGSSTRTYLFEFHGTYKEFWDGKLGKTFPVNAKEKVTWDGKSHRLSIHAEERGFYFDTVYQCDMDPLLSVDAPKCKRVSTKTNWKGDWSVAWGGDNRTEIEQLRDSISTGRRFALTLEALAKSMRVEVSSSKVKSPPGNVLLMVHTDPTILPLKGWSVTFWIEKEYGGVRFNDLYGKEVDNHHQATLLRGTTFYLLRNLQAGQYTFWTIMNTTLTGDRIASKNPVIFKVVNDLQTPVILTPKEGARLGKKSEITVRVAGTPDLSDILDTRLEVQYSKLAKQYPYKALRVIKSGGHPFYPGGVWKCSCPIGDKLGVPLEGDFRIRARMFYQDKPMGDWSEWRHFHVGKEVVAIIERPFKIISPAEGQNYSNEIPVKISLPGFVGENPRLTLTWIWTPATRKASNGLDIHGFPHELMKETVSVDSGKMTLLTYHGSMKVKSLYDKVKNVMGSTGGGSFSLRADLKFSDMPVRSRYVTFYAGMLGTPAKKDEEKKKDLSYHMNSIPQFLPMKSFYRPGEDIGLRLRNAPPKGLQFEVRYRPAAGGAYKSLYRVPHRLNRFGETATLHLKFREPGWYQIRLRAGKTTPWGKWHALQVGSMASTAAKGVKKVHPSVAPFHFKAPMIREPKANQAFMLAGHNVNVTLKIAHLKGFKVVTEFQRKEHGRYVSFRPKTFQQERKKETIVETWLTETGDYRMRTRINAPHAQWSAWRHFKVDKPATNLIHRVAPKPSSPKGIHLNPTGIKLK